MRRPILLLCALLLCAACSEPPQKEIDMAQGAIDAARAAGADEYAPESFDAARGALRAAHDAVAQGDYRLALSRALDARERAQQAAKLAADGKARERSAGEAEIQAVESALRDLSATLESAAAANLPAADLSKGQRASEAASAALQKARAAFGEGNYLQARAAIKTTREEISAAIGALDEALAARPSRPPRRRGSRS